MGMLISNQTDTFCELHFIFRENSILLQNETLPDELTIRKCLSMNVADDWFTEPELNYSAMMLEPNTPNPVGCNDIPLRSFFYRAHSAEDFFVPGTDKKTTGAELTALASRARGLLTFKKTKRFCERCGGALHDDEHFTARTCAQCGHIYFPQIEPAVIVLISKGDEILLANHKNRSDNMFSCIAGFVEAGETVEQAVRREIAEETALTVKNIRYVGSQSWPYPDQLMLAFHAEYESGEISLQEEELREAKWFTRNNLPKIPGPGSVAYNLIMGILQ